MCVEEGTYISSHRGELLNSKSEWHQAKLIRTTTRVIQGGADSLREQAAGGRAGGGGQRVRDQPREQGRARGQWSLFKKHTTIQKHSVCFASFSFWSRSCPYILDSLVVPIRSDQDNKVETCLLKQSNSLLSRPTQTMNRNLTRKAGAWTDLLPKGWMLSFWTAFHHHHILIELILLPKKLADCDSDLSALVILVRFVGAKHIQGYCGYFESE